MGSSGDELDALRAENERLRRRLAREEGAGGVAPSAAFLRAAVESTPAFIVAAGADDRLRYVNRLYPGFRREEVIGSSLYDHVDEASEARMRAAVEEARETGRPVRYEATGAGPSGAVSSYQCCVSPVPDGDGLGVCIVAVDFTDRLRQERALRDSEARLRVAYSATKMGLWSFDPATGEVVWDEGMHQLTGLEEPVAPDAYLERLVHPDDRARVTADVEQNLARSVVEPNEHRIVRSDGEVRWVMASGRAVRSEDGRATRFVGGNLDVTARRRVEEQLRQAQKLDAVGRLTAGVAHNFNNMLAAILPALELLRPRVDERDRRLVDDALHAGTRAAEMVRQLMTFAGQSRDGSWGPREPSQLVDAALGICRRTFDRHIELSTALAPDLPMLVGDAGALEQVLVNLLLNARDAVAAEPSPRIAVSVDVARDGAVEPPSPELASATSYVRIRVEDNGQGMSEAVRGRIFEPFFTTKDVGAGTGLGLATSYTIVREHGGWIDCASRPGRGATFTVHLPTPDRVPRAVEPEAFAARSSSARILVVDDEDAVRYVVGRLLGKLGHEVEGAADGDAALAALEDAEVDVVLLDLSMPGAPGDRFVEAIRARRPAVKILLFTGHEVPAALRERVDGVVPKPVTRAQLERVLAEALAHDGSAERGFAGGRAPS